MVVGKKKVVKNIIVKKKGIDSGGADIKAAQGH
jgi:hypothetical protein